MRVPGKVILEVVVGSTVHGTAVQDGLEDLDLMAVVIEDAGEVLGFSPKDVWTMRDKPVGVRSEAGDTDYVAYGLRKFLGLALKGNPSILLALFCPDSHTRIITEEGRQLRDLVPIIVSRQVYEPFRGYMRQQHERLLGLRGQRNVTRPELVEKHGFDTKYASHIVRLGFQGEELLRTGRITLPMPPTQRQKVLQVRNGAFTLADVSHLLIAAEKMLELAHEVSSLPDRPDQEGVERWMRTAYLEHWKGGR